MFLRNSPQLKHHDHPGGSSPPFQRDTLNISPKVRPSSPKPSLTAFVHHPASSPTAPREPLARFLSLQKIGSGAYGTVFSAIDPESNNLRVAVKAIENVFDDPKEAYRALLELKLLRHFREEEE